MKKNGFTLIELLVVVAVLALLASIVFSNLGGAREGARISNALSFQSQTHSLLGSDLVGWWNFNDPSDRYKDISGSGNNGSCTSCPTAADGVPGTGGTAMEFDGVNNIIQTSKEMGIDNRSFSISFWTANMRTSGTGHAVGGGTATLNEGLHVGNANGKLRFGFFANDLDSDSNFTTDGSWQYWVTTFNHENKERIIYLNSALDAQDVSSSNFLGTGNFEIGKVILGGARDFPYEGKLDDVRIYNRALSAQETRMIYAQTKDKYLSEE